MRVGIAADHGGFEMKEQLAKKLAAEGHQVIDFGNMVYDAADDYPDFAIPLARAVVTRICRAGCPALRQRRGRRR
jgi:ribose 5-phosphate isomerase B